ncbi:MAG: hypothetical protein IJD65_02300 [Mailhella sp.]|nr:hypothetical protein [Mailhella sp.]
MKKMKKSMYEAVMKGNWENVLKMAQTRKAKVASKSSDDFYFSADQVRQKLRLGPNDMLEVLNTTDSTNRLRTNRDDDFLDSYSDYIDLGGEPCDIYRYFRLSDLQDENLLVHNYEYQRFIGADDGIRFYREDLIEVAKDMIELREKILSGELEVEIVEDDLFEGAEPTIEELYEKAEAIIANKDEIISGLEARIAELEHSVLAGDTDDFPAEYENHGVFTMVAKMVLARASVPEIMKALDNEKDFLSQREVGYFFHPSPEGKAANTLRNYTKNNKSR